MTFKGALRSATMVTYAVAAILAALAIRGRIVMRDRGPSVSGSVEAALPAGIDAETFYRMAAEGQRLGPDDAPVVIVVFSNYFCGHCAEFEVTLERIRRRYPDVVAIVVKSFVPSLNRSERLVHEAAECAAEQGKFAEYYHAFFRVGQGLVTHEAWRDVGDSARIPDRARFTVCTRSGRYAGRIERDTREARALGVNGTPISFVNGVRVIGTVSFEGLNQMIAANLGRVHAP
jgi:protein-disulfide isomerase